eukprot:COSAG02_NODE_43063_length_378_cov_1.107527_1_plen_31_part_10
MKMVWPTQQHQMMAALPPQQYLMMKAWLIRW